MESSAFPDPFVVSIINKHLWKGPAQRTRTWHDNQLQIKHLAQHWILLLGVTLRAWWHDEQMGIEMVANLLVLVVIGSLADVDWDKKGWFWASLHCLWGGWGAEYLYTATLASITNTRWRCLIIAKRHRYFHTYPGSTFTLHFTDISGKVVSS